MNTQIKIVLFTLLVTGFYTYVGRIVPQTEAHPPASTEISADMSPAQLAKAGKGVFFGKGTCALCHTIGGKGDRCPDLAGVGARAASRVEGLAGVEYLAQSLYQPTAYVVEGYPPTMPRIDKPPIGLSASEIVAVVAFLQSNGGEISVAVVPRFEAAGESATAPEPATPASDATGSRTATAIIEHYGCRACHSLDGPERLLGPSLFDLGARQDKAAILHSILEPDAVMAEGDPPFPPGLMAATLSATGFYDQLSLAELNTLADHLTQLRGPSE